MGDKETIKRIILASVRQYKVDMYPDWVFRGDMYPETATDLIIDKVLTDIESENITEDPKDIEMRTAIYMNNLLEYLATLPRPVGYVKKLKLKPRSAKDE